MFRYRVVLIKTSQTNRRFQVVTILEIFDFDGGPRTPRSGFTTDFSWCFPSFPRPYLFVYTLRIFEPYIVGVYIEKKMKFTAGERRRRELRKYWFIDTTIHRYSRVSSTSEMSKSHIETKNVDRKVDHFKARLSCYHSCSIKLGLRLSRKQ